MIYVDASQLYRFLQAGKPATGIQRLTLNCLVGLQAELGNEAVKAIVYSTEKKQFLAAGLNDFFAKAQERFLPLNVSQQDAFLLIEWYWNKVVFDAGLAVGKTEGAKHFRFIHDVIPVARPDLVRSDISHRFQVNTERAIAAADAILTNSDFSKQDILKHFPHAVARPIHVLKLPHEFTVVDGAGKITPVDRQSEISTAQLRPSILQLAGQEFALMVGTLEERKNTLLAVKAWKRLAREHGARMPKLVLVGFYSAHNLLYTASLVLRTRLSRNVVHLSDCSDLELAWLYQKCRFTIYISQYEGWGLPIGESLWFGKPVLTQRVTSLPEAGGDLATYVDAHNVHALDAAINQNILRGVNSEKMDRAVVPSHLYRWQEFATDLLSRMKDY